MWQRREETESSRHQRWSLGREQAVSLPVETDSWQSWMRRKLQEKEALELRIHRSPRTSCCTASGPGTQILIPVSGKTDSSPDLIPALL